MDLIGQPIKHRIFGPGVVTDLAGDSVTISFKDTEKKFIYPDAFQTFLVFNDRESQRYIEKKIAERERSMQKERLAEQAEQDLKRKLLNFTIIANSHGVFNVTEEQLCQIRETGQLSSGTYFSGRFKGQPRVADRMKPNSLCLLTTRPSGQDEQQRVLAGAFMVREDFFGEDDHDGIIIAHARHQLFLPKDSRPLFWKYFGPSTPPRWGNTAFKYCSGTVACEMLTGMTELGASAGDETAWTDFYDYFCKMNRMRPIMAAPGSKAGPGRP